MSQLQIAEKEVSGWDEQLKAIQVIAADRRNDRRYELKLDMRWKLIRRRRIMDCGSGETIDISSGGILFNAGRKLPVGFNVEVSVSWPMLLHNTAPLQLIVSGKIVRTRESLTAIQMEAHEFRTVAQAVQMENAEALSLYRHRVTPN
jgi:PilZ domain